MKLDQRGFSLVQVMVAAAMLGGLALSVMQIMKVIADGQIAVRVLEDKIALRSEIMTILANENYCRVSIAGDGPQGVPILPVKFEKKDVLTHETGIPLEFFLSNQLGDTRTVKKFSALDEVANKYNRLTIKSITLAMKSPPQSKGQKNIAHVPDTDGTLKEIDCGENYCPSFLHSDIGEVKIVLEEQMSASGPRQTIMRFNLNVDMRTDKDLKSTLISCNIRSTSKGKLYCQRLENRCALGPSTQQSCTSKVSAPANFTLVGGECFYNIGDNPAFGSVMRLNKSIDNQTIKCQCESNEVFPVECNAVGHICQVL